MSLTVDIENVRGTGQQGDWTWKVNTVGIVAIDFPKHDLQTISIVIHPWPQVVEGLTWNGKELGEEVGKSFAEGKVTLSLASTFVEQTRGGGGKLMVIDYYR